MSAARSVAKCARATHGGGGVSSPRATHKSIGSSHAAGGGWRLFASVLLLLLLSACGEATSDADEQTDPPAHTLFGSAAPAALAIEVPANV